MIDQQYSEYRSFNLGDGFHIDQLMLVRDQDFLPVFTPQHFLDVELVVMESENTFLNPLVILPDEDLIIPTDD